MVGFEDKLAGDGETTQRWKQSDDNISHDPLNLVS